MFTNISMIEHGDTKDVLGRAYEYCLSKFAEQEGKLAGEFYTPSCIVRTLVEVLKPYNGRVYDIIMQKLIQFNGCSVRRFQGGAKLPEGVQDIRKGAKSAKTLLVA